MLLIATILTAIVIHVYIVLSYASNCSAKRAAT